MLTNTMVSIEQHADWIGECLAWMRARGHRRIEADAAAERDSVAHVNAVAADGYQGFAFDNRSFPN